MVGEGKDGYTNGGGAMIAVESSNAVLESLGRLRLDRHFTDCTLLVPAVPPAPLALNGSPVTEKRIECHRAVLASASPYFADALKAPGTVLHLREHSLDEIEVVVAFIYTGRAELHEDNLFRVYEASSRLGISSLSDACAEFLVDHAREEGMSLFQRLDIGLRLGVPRLVQPCMEELLVSDAVQLESEEVLLLGEKAMLIFLKSEDLQVEEVALFRALISWGKSRCPSTMPLGVFMAPYVPWIRYALMTPAEIEEEVRIYDFVPRELLLDAALALCKNPVDWDASKMLFRQRNSVFVYRWRIFWDGVKDQEEVWSDSFSFFFGGVEHHWKLLMYPNGKNAPKHISFFLYVDPDDPNGKKWRKHVDFDFLLTDFSKRRRTQFFAKEPSAFSPDTQSWGFAKFRERHLVESLKSSYLKDGHIEFELAMKMHAIDQI